MKDEERAKLWRTLRVAAAILGTLCVVYGFYVNQVIWTAAGFTAVLLVYYFSSRSSKLREAWFNHAMTTVVRNIERANHYAVQRLPVGIAVFDQEGHLQWKNRLFNEYINVDAPLGSLLIRSCHRRKIILRPSGSVIPIRASKLATASIPCWSVPSRQQKKLAVTRVLSSTCMM